jgi:hypothetical protein
MDVGIHHSGCPMGGLASWQPGNVRSAAGKAELSWIPAAGVNLTEPGMAAASQARRAPV